MFQDVEQPAQDVQQNGVEQASEDLLALFGSQTTEDADERETETEVEAQTEAQAEDAGQAEEQEQPDGDSEQEELSDIDWNVKARIRENGQDRTLTLQELRDGFLRQSDYTRKQQELAQERQQLEAMFGEVNNQKSQYEQLLEQQQQQLEALIPKEPDWGQLAADNPQAYQRQRAAWDQLQGQLQSVTQERQRVANERQQTYGQQMQAYLQQQQQQLLTAKPELQDMGKRQEFFTNIAQYAQHEYGISPQELSAIGDHRLFLIAEKARKYDELHGGAKGKEAGKKPIPPLKAGQSPDDKPSSRKLREARSRFNKSGSVEDAAALIGQLG